MLRSVSNLLTLCLDQSSSCCKMYLFEALSLRSQYFKAHYALQSLYRSISDLQQPIKASKCCWPVIANLIISSAAEIQGNDISKQQLSIIQNINLITKNHKAFLMYYYIIDFWMKTLLSRTIIVILIAIWTISGKEYSPLRVMSDENENDVEIKYYQRGNASSYQLIIPRDSSYHNDNYYSFCFRRRVTIKQAIICSLGNLTGNYDCLTQKWILVSGFIPTFVIYHYQMTPDFLVKLDFNFFSPANQTNTTTNSAFTLSLNGKIQIATNISINFSYLGLKNEIYEVITIPGQDFINAGHNLKRNFLSTFAASQSYFSDNLLLQRNVQCYIYKDIINYIFYGGTLRNGIQIFFVAFINYSPTKNYQLWEGLSFSKDKSNRDMLGVLPLSNDFEDLYSLYASAPFLDTSSNINGTNDWVKFGQSRQSNETPSNYYFMQLYRPYFTEDQQGDEPLIYKIDNQYCYAAYFSQISDPSSFQLDLSFNFLNKALSHQLLECFTPSLRLLANYLLFSPSIFFLLLLLII